MSVDASFLLMYTRIFSPPFVVRHFNPGSHQPLPVSVGELKPLPTGLVWYYADHTQRAEQYNMPRHSHKCREVPCTSVPTTCYVAEENQGVATAWWRFIEKVFPRVLEKVFI